MRNYLQMYAIAFLALLFFICPPSLADDLMSDEEMIQLEIRLQEEKQARVLKRRARRKAIRLQRQAEYDRRVCQEKMERESQPEDPTRIVIGHKVSEKCK